MLNFKSIKNFFNKEELTFSCLIPEVVETYPITPSGKISYKWAKEMVANLKNTECPINKHIMHVARCPGIALVAKNGWIQRSYQDIYIKTDENGNFQWSTPLDQKTLIKESEFAYPYIGFHHPSATEPYGILKPHTLGTIIKIQSPWTVVVPKGYYLLCMPIPYHDDNRFTASFGLIDGDAGINFLNVQLFWHSLNKEELIPAGTPLAQYFLIKKENINISVGPYDDSILKKLKKRILVLDSTFSRRYIDLKKDI